MSVSDELKEIAEYIASCAILTGPDSIHSKRKAVTRLMKIANDLDQENTDTQENDHA